MFNLRKHETLYPRPQMRQSGKGIHALSKEQGITLQELAERTRLSRGLLSKIENGIVSTPVSTLFNIGWALRAKISQFLDDPEENPPSALFRSGERKHYGKTNPSLLYYKTYEDLAYKRRKVY